MRRWNVCEVLRSPNGMRQNETEGGSDGCLSNILWSDVGLVVCPLEVEHGVYLAAAGVLRERLEVRERVSIWCCNKIEMPVVATFLLH